MELATLQRIQADETILNEIRSRMYAGTVLVTVDEPLNADTRSTKDFIGMTTGGICNANGMPALGHKRT